MTPEELKAIEERAKANYPQSIAFDPEIDEAGTVVVWGYDAANDVKALLLHVKQLQAENAESLQIHKDRLALMEKLEAQYKQLEKRTEEVFGDNTRIGQERDQLAAKLAACEQRVNYSKQKVGKRYAGTIFAGLDDDPDQSQADGTDTEAESAADLTEPSMEAVWVQVLRYLEKYPMTSGGAIARELKVSLEDMHSVLKDMLYEGLIWHYWHETFRVFQYQLSRKGMDYLANLDVNPVDFGELTEREILDAEPPFIIGDRVRLTVPSLQNIYGEAGIIVKMDKFPGTGAMAFWVQFDGSGASHPMHAVSLELVEASEDAAE